MRIVRSLSVLAVAFALQPAGATRAQAPVPAVTFFPVAARCLRLGA
jgi:hypothetical protein